MNKIKNKRLDLGFKQFKVAERLGISSRHYARLENSEREPKLLELEQLSIMFNCPISDLKED